MRTLELCSPTTIRDTSSLVSGSSSRLSFVGASFVGALFVFSITWFKGRPLSAAPTRWRPMIARPVRSRCALILVAILFAQIRLAYSASIAGLQNSFLNPPDDSRIMMRWWWFGPAVTKTQLEREMRLMKEGGIGGFEVQPVYPVVLDDAGAGIKTFPFLSDGFLDALRFTSEKARELGLRFDLTLGSGWPFGGPMVSIDHAAARVRYEHVKIEEGARFVKVPSIGAGEKLLAVFLARVEGSSLAADGLRELTSI